VEKVLSTRMSTMAHSGGTWGRCLHWNSATSIEMHP